MAAVATPANGAPPLALSASRVRGFDLRLAERAQAAYALLLAAPGLLERLTHPDQSKIRWGWYKMKKDEGVGPMVKVALQLVDLKNAGAPEAAGTQLLAYLAEIQRDLYAGAEHRTVPELDRAEIAAEAAENRLTHELTNGHTPQLLRDAASANRTEAAVELERARILDREAARLERGVRNA